MPNREKVMRGLINCGTPGMPCEECPYYDKQSECSDLLCMDAVALLKKLEPKSPIIKENSYRWKFYYCPSCGKEFYQNNKFRFCEICGQAVKWDD